MKRHTPYAASCLIFVLVLFGMPALADHKSTGSTQAGPGETVTISTGRRADYTELTLANQGPGGKDRVPSLTATAAFCSAIDDKGTSVFGRHIIEEISKAEQLSIYRGAGA